MTGLGIRDIEFIVDEQMLALTEVDMSSTEYRTTYPSFTDEELHIEVSLFNVFVVHRVMLPRLREINNHV